ncbi:hypothetical protein BaRGS_00025460 [Batillaria attramentaria]|uniref:Fibronectin type III-like domain-containing protein n=1 Tax=Batillaria attramentaria TaxID=370345 RepID=A0ABD0K897_9CAEN
MRLLLLCMLAASACCSDAVEKDVKTDPRPTNFPFFNVSLSWEERVFDLVSRLTLAEAVLQMSRGGAREIGGPAPAISRLNIGPYQWDTECLRGDVRAPGNATSFPQSLGLAASFSSDLMYRVAEATGVEVRAKHNQFVQQGVFTDHTGASCFSPVINIMRDGRWGRNQGDDPRYIRASSGCKHFAAYDGPDSQRAEFNAVVSEEDLRMTFLPAFKACVDAGTFSIMCSYNSVNGVPACANKHLLTDILREDWGFSGYVVSDQSAIELIQRGHHYLNDSIDIATACVNAGCNLELSGDNPDPVFFSIAPAVQLGLITMDTVMERVKPLFYTRMRLGEFDPPEMNPYSKLGSQDVQSQQTRQLSLEAAMKTFVLLKNRNYSFLPLSAGSYNKIGVVGPLANDSKQMYGDYAANPSPEYVVTPLQGLQKIFQNVKYAAGCRDGPLCTKYSPDDVKQAVKQTQVNFVILGTGVVAEKEGMDREDLELPGNQKQLLMDVLTYTGMTPVVLVLINAGPLNISFADADDRVTAILECFFPAQAAGDALRHVILNDVPGAVPAGRLPYTWPKYFSQDFSMSGRTYRYHDRSHGDPLYPFGYGLSYTTFTFSDLDIPSVIKAGQALNGSVRIDNTGKVDGDEVLEVYISWDNTSLPAPRLQLVWFDRVAIQTGSFVQLKFQVSAHSMALWMNGGWVIPPGNMTLYAGGQQPSQARQAPSNVVSANFTIVPADLPNL